MSETLTRQLHDYFEYLDEAQGEIDLVTIRKSRIGDGPVRRVQHEPLPRPPVRRGLLVAVAAAILVLAAGVVPLLLISGGDDSADDPVTTSATQQSTTTPQVTHTTLTALPLEALGAELVEVIVLDVTVAPSVVGDFRITTVQTDARFAPGGLVETPFGFGSVSLDGSHLLVSEDAIAWFAAPSPFTFPLVRREGGAVSGDEDIGYTVLTKDRDGTILQWHSADYIRWVLVDPSTADPVSDSPRPPSPISYEVDKLPPFECFEPPNETACGTWFSLDSGWAFFYGPGVQGGLSIPDWASADGVNWEQVAYDGGWETIHGDRIPGPRFFGGEAGNVAIFGVMADDPSDTPAPSWYWVTQLP